MKILEKFKSEKRHIDIDIAILETLLNHFKKDGSELIDTKDIQKDNSILDNEDEFLEHLNMLSLEGYLEISNEKKKRKAKITLLGFDYIKELKKKSKAKAFDYTLEYINKRIQNSVFLIKKYYGISFIAVLIILNILGVIPYEYLTKNIKLLSDIKQYQIKTKEIYKQQYYKNIDFSVVNKYSKKWIPGTNILNDGKYFYTGKNEEFPDSVFYTKGSELFENRGIALIEYSYDNNNNIIKEKFYSVGKNLLIKSVDIDGCNILEFGYNSDGEKTERRCLGEDGSYKNTPSGYSILKIKYFMVSGNKIEEESYYGEDGKQTKNNNGYYVLRKYKNNRGEVIKEKYFGEDGRETTNDKGYYGVKYEINAWKKNTRITYLGRKDTTLKKDGMPSIITYEYLMDTENNQSEIIERYYSTDGTPTLDEILGVHKIITKNDLQGRKTSVGYFGIDGKPINSINGRSGEKIQYILYDKKDPAEKELIEWQIERVFLINKEGKEQKGEVNDINPYMTFKNFDKNGYVIFEAYFDKNEKVFNKQNGIGSFKNIYDSEMKLIRQDFCLVDFKTFSLKPNNLCKQITDYFGKDKSNITYE